MAAPSCCRSPMKFGPRLLLSPNTNILRPREQSRGIFSIVAKNPSSENALPSSAKGEVPIVIPPEDQMPERARAVPHSVLRTLARARLPLSLQAMYAAPLRRRPTHGVKSCDLQLRSFSVRNLELQADFAMRAAYYLGLPALGPVPLPRITQRWTVPRSNFVHKKSQENFERVHVRRLVQIRDGDPEVVQYWLGYLCNTAYHGVGMKATVWEHEALGVGARMDEAAGETDKAMEEEWGNFGIGMNATTAEKVEELLGSEAFSKPRRLLDEFYREPIEIKRKP